MFACKSSCGMQHFTDGGTEPGCRWHVKASIRFPSLLLCFMLSDGYDLRVEEATLRLSTVLHAEVLFGPGSRKGLLTGE